MNHFSPALKKIVWLVVTGIFFSLVAVAQSHISGKIINSEDGKPVVGASVKVKGTAAGTATDSEGNFTLTAKGNDELVVSYVGYVSRDVPIANQSVLNITLSAAPNTLNEVLVIGYGTQKRADLTGAVSSVKGDEIRNIPATSISEALQGRSAGVEVIKGSAQPGSGANIIIRGLSSLNNKAPLYIVDGVRQSGDNLDLSTVASIDILKDASAASIYGSAAAGGVILITTKKGSLGKPRVNFSSQYGVLNPKVIDLLGTEDFVNLRRMFTPTYLAGQDISQLPHTNWSDEIYRQGSEQTYNLSVSGANETSSYLVSGFYNKEEGIFIRNQSSIYGGRVNTEFKLGNRVRVGEQLYINERTDNPFVDVPQNPPFRSIPIMAVYDPTNPVGGYAKSPAGFGGRNIVGFAYSSDIINKGLNVQGNAFAEVKLPINLNFRTTLGYTINDDNNARFDYRYDFGAVVRANNSLQKNFVNRKQLLSNFLLTYDKSINDHNIKILAGYEQITNKTSGVTGTQTNQAQEPSFSFFPTTLTTQQSAGNFDENGLIKSKFGRINYDYAGKYLFMAAVRRDGNFTKFGPGKQYGVFPSTSVGWRISEEKFFQNMLPKINFMKFRASYGVLGNDNIPSYLFLSTFGLTGAQNFSAFGDRNLAYTTTNIPNPNIKWESIYETNVGADVEFLKGKLYATADWYKKTTEGMLFALPVPSSSGFTTGFFTNIGNVRNTGFELSAGYKDSYKKFRYDVSANAAFNKNIVLSLDNTNGTAVNSGQQTDYGLFAKEFLTRTVAGRSFGEFFGYKALGIYQTDEEAAKNPQFAGVTAKAGDLKFQDTNNDGVLNTDDRTFIGNPNPKLVYGVNVNLAYQGFDLKMLFNGVMGVDLYSVVSANTQYLFDDGNTTSKVFGASFLGTNQVTNQPRLGNQTTDANGVVRYVFDPNGNYSKVNSYFVESGNYMKLKNVQLGYNLHGKWLSNLSLRQTRIFLMGVNLLTITRYSGTDPEVGGGVTDRGIDGYIRYPQAKAIYAGLNIGL